MAMDASTRAQDKKTPHMILDASAFYAGVPFGSPDSYRTTPAVYEEIEHIKGRQKAVRALVDAGKLAVMSPDPVRLDGARAAARKTGDLPNLSAQDISVLALAIQTGQPVITDDYAVSNVARMLDITVFPVMTRGIRTVGTWSYRCPACNKPRLPAKSCPVCGATLKRKLRRKKTASALPDG